jgi:hypothetical protein
VSTERQQFESLSSEEKKQLSILGNMLAQAISDEDAEQQALMDAFVDAREQEARKAK